MKKILPILLTIILFLNFADSFAQKLDETYLPEIKGNIYPRNMVQQTDGKILVLGGNFKFVDALHVNQLIRLNSDGSLDNTFNPPDFEKSYHKVIVTKGGKIIVYQSGSNFLNLNADGSLDKEFKFKIENVFNPSIKNICAIDSAFFITYYNPGLGLSILDKFNENGEKVKSFKPVQFDGEWGGFIYLLEKLENGKLFVSGDFNNVNGYEKNNLVLINPDGTIDNSFDPGSGFEGTSFEIRIHQEKILAFGYISTYNGEKFPKGIVRLNLDGTIDDSFVSGIIASSFSSYHPSGIMVDKNDDLFVIGPTRAGNDFSYELLKFTSEGLIDSSFTKIPMDLDRISDADILQNDDNDLFVFGNLHTFGAKPIYNLVKINPTESKIYDLDLKLRGIGVVKKAVKLKNGNTAIMGDFTDVGNTPQPKFAILNKEGLLDKNFKLNYNFKKHDHVNSLMELEDGNILIGGRFKTDESKLYLEKILLKINPSGTVDPSFDVHSNNSYSSVKELKKLNNGQILLLGSFSKINESEVRTLAKINESGDLDLSYNPNINFHTGWHYDEIEFLSDSKIILGGIKLGGNSPSYSKIIILDSTGVLDPSFKEIINYDIRINTVNKLTANKIIYGGSTSLPSHRETRNPLLQYNIKSGFNDSLSIRSLYMDNNPSFNDIMVLDSNNFLVGGKFDEINGFDNQGLAKFKPNGKIDRHFNFNVDREINSIVKEDDEHILVFGNFNKIQGIEAYSAARIKISNFIPKLEEELQLKVAEDSIMNFTAASLGIIDEDDPLEEVSVTFLPGENYTVDNNKVIPKENFSGELKIAVKVSDEKDTVDIIITVKILAKNDPPVIQDIVSEISIFETTSVAITKENFIFSDPDNTLDEIDLILLGGENYQVKGDSIVVQNGFNGKISVRAQATDGESLGEVFQFTIDVQTFIGKNEPPQITKLVSDLTIFETTSIAIAKEDFSISDPDNTQDEIDLILLDGENYQVIGDSIVVEEGFNGEITVRAQATDGESLSEIFEFTIDVQTVIGKNQPPVITKLVSDLTIFETTSIAITKEDFIFSDPDNTQDEIDLILLDGENYQVIGDSIVVEEGFNGEITVRAQATDGESLGEVFEFTIEVQTITGLEDEILGKLIIYPNPAKSFLNITNQNNIPILGINVVELSGKIHTVVYKKENNGLVLNISHLKPGLYLINILLQNGTVIKKIQIE